METAIPFSKQQPLMWVGCRRFLIWHCPGSPTTFQLLHFFHRYTIMVSAVSVSRYIAADKAEKCEWVEKQTLCRVDAEHKKWQVRRSLSDPFLFWSSPSLSLGSLSGSRTLKQVFEIVLRGLAWIHTSWSQMSHYTCFMMLSVITHWLIVISPQLLDQNIPMSMKHCPQEVNTVHMNYLDFLLLHLKILLQAHSPFHTISFYSSHMIISTPRVVEKEIHS